jgi:hypothetical protein
MTTTQNTELSRKFDEVRRVQGFRSQGHLDAFYAYFDHTHGDCEVCGQSSVAMWLDGSASWQPTVQECEIGRQLFIASCGS